MARKLDFIVLGTGRSGTSAVSRYLSAVEGLHCGLELFSPWTDHATLHPPACFLDLTRDALPKGMRRPSPKLLQFSLDEIGRRGDSIRFFGNKTPNYLFRLQGLLQEIAPGRALVCWRDLRSVAESFARRADDPEDNWDPGRRAIFAAADMMVCLRALADLGSQDAMQDVMIVPNRAVVANWDAATRAMVAHLLPDFGAVTYDPVNLAAIDKRLQKSKSAPHPDPVWSAVEEQAIRAIEATGIDALMNRSAPYLLSEVIDDLRATVARLPEDVIRHTHSLVKADGGVAGIDYFERWSRMTSFGRPEAQDPQHQGRKGAAPGALGKRAGS